MSKNFEKTWKPGPAKTTVFNTPGSLSIPYGRYRGLVSGRGASSTAPNASTWSTNYNVSYPVANQPINAYPAAAWNTNYNVAYPVANQPVNSYPVNAWNTNYNVSYPVSYPYAGTYTYASWVLYQLIGQICSGSVNAYSVYKGPWYGLNNPPCVAPSPATPFFASGVGTQYSGSNQLPCPSGTPQGSYYYWLCQGSRFDVNNYNTAYNVVYSPGSTPAAAWNTVWSTNYSVSYPVASQPVNAWNTVWSTNYNVAYPVANQPINAYNVAAAGAPTTVLGVTFPGAAKTNTIGVPNLAPAVPNTEYSYWLTQDNVSYPVSVPAGGNVTITME